MAYFRCGGGDSSPTYGIMIGASANSGYSYFACDTVSNMTNDGTNLVVEKEGTYLLAA